MDGFTRHSIQMTLIQGGREYQQICLITNTNLTQNGIFLGYPVTRPLKFHEIHLIETSGRGELLP